MPKITDEQTDAQPRVLTIDITVVDEEVQYKCDNSDAWLTKVQPGDTVIFHCKEPFAIDFKGVTPFTKMSPRPETGNTISCTVGGHANVGTYPYTVAVYANGKVYIDDPQVVVPANTVPPVRTEHKPTGPVQPVKPGTH